MRTQINLQAVVGQSPLWMVADLLCEPCDPPHFFQHRMVAMSVEPIVIGESGVGLDWYEILESVFE